MSAFGNANRCLKRHTGRELRDLMGDIWAADGHRAAGDMKGTHFFAKPKVAGTSWKRIGSTRGGEETGWKQ